MDEFYPASRADIVHLQQDMQQSMQKMYESLGSTLQKMYSDLRAADDQILAVLVNVDQRLTKQVKDHERRIVRLERKTA